MTRRLRILNHYSWSCRDRTCAIRTSGEIGVMKLPNLSEFIDEHIITEVFTREGLVFSHAGCKVGIFGPARHFQVPKRALGGIFLLGKTWNSCFYTRFVFYSSIPFIWAITRPSMTIIIEVGIFGPAGHFRLPKSALRGILGLATRCIVVITLYLYSTHQYLSVEVSYAPLRQLL